MQPCLFSSEYLELQKAEQVSSAHMLLQVAALQMSEVRHVQGVIQALEVAADAVDELSKGSEANQASLEQHCTKFLTTVKVHLLSAHHYKRSSYPLLLLHSICCTKAL